MPLERHFQRYGLRLLQLYRYVFIRDRAAVSSDHFQRMSERHIVGVVQRDRGVLEIDRLNLIETLLPVVRDVLVARHGGEYAARAGRVTIGIVAAPRRNLKRPREIAVPVQKPHHYPCSIDLGVYIERFEHASRGTYIFPPFPVRVEPGLFPVGRILLVPSNHVPHTLRERALGGNDLKRLFDNVVDIVRHERQRVHGRDVYPAVPPVAVVHDMTDRIAYVRGGVHHARTHEPGKVRLDLKVDIFRTRVVQPMARRRRFHAVQHIVPSLLIREPQVVLSLGERVGERLSRRIQPFVFKHLHKREVHIDVIVRAGILLVRLLEIPVVPGNNLIILDQRTVVLKLDGGAERDADRLCHPRPFYLVLKNLPGDSYLTFVQHARAGVACNQHAANQHQHHTQRSCLPHFNPPLHLDLHTQGIRPLPTHGNRSNSGNIYPTAASRPHH